jgi:hypothetical protein
MPECPTGGLQFDLFLFLDVSVLVSDVSGVLYCM